jgi:hypothetical protein
VDIDELPLVIAPNDGCAGSVSRPAQRPVRDRRQTPEAIAPWPPLEERKAQGSENTQSLRDSGNRRLTALWAQMVSAQKETEGLPKARR